MGKNRLQMSVGLFTAAISIAFVAGAAAVWVTAGMTWSLPGDGSGSNADWLAAYGTWAIGLGAIFFALVGHLQRKDEIRHAKAVAADECRTHVTSATLALADAALVKSSVDRFLSLPADQRIYGRLRISTQILRIVSKRVDVGVDALKHMPLDASPLVARINAALDAVQGLIDTIEMDEGRPLGNEDEVEPFDVEFCEQIAELGEELIQMCNEFRAMAMRIVNSSQDK